MNTALNKTSIKKGMRGLELSNFKLNIRAYTMISILLGIWIIFTLATEGTFLSSRNLALLVRQATVTSVLALGMALVIIAGHIDLSAGSVLGLCGGIAAILQVKMGWSIIPTIIVTILLGALMGAWQGFWVAYKKVPAFIVTLGGYMMFRGVLLGITKSVAISLSSPVFKAIGQAYLPKEVGLALAAAAVATTVIMVLKTRNSRKEYGFNISPLYQTILKMCFFSALIIIFTIVMNNYEGIPVPVVILLCLTLIITFVATRTKFGRCIYAIGGNPEAARLSGINIKQVTLLIFVLMGLLASIAGIILTARLNAATSSAGMMAEMDAIAACVIGGASLMGGVGSIPFALIGSLVMASLDNGMSLMNTENFWQQIIKGLILIIAVWVDMSTKKK